MNDQSASLPYKDQPAAISYHILEPKVRMAGSAAAHRDLASKKDPDPMADDHPDIEVPQYFVCPISLQIMRDPVTVVTGITYDRDSIEKWLAKSRGTAADSACPVTMQPLPRDSALTPNHTLRRLIQAWCVTNAKNGVDRIPTPKAALDAARVLRLVRDLQFKGLCLKTLKRLDELGLENERNRWCMAEAGVAEAGVAEAMVPLINKFSDENSDGLEECMRIFNWTWTSGRPGLRLLVQENSDLVDSLSWILQSTNNNTAVKNSAMAALKHVVEVANVALLERLKLETFEAIVKAVSEVRNRRISTPPSIQQVSQVAAVVKCALQVLIDASPWGRNRQKIVKAGAVFELIELELEKPEQKRVSEMVFELLAQLCSCADGRERLLGHAGGIAVLAKRTLRVSPVVDDRTVQILAMVSQFSASKGVLMEILRVGAVSKLCMVMQADCSVSLKKKARSILRMHSSVWNNSPCIAVYLLTRDTDR
ncbi:hypothetical protein SAY86_032147 [Trapa natans]|uniref:U-box domain-containing protein n=1 Tax=Trapa natans TaxID=22666 RepID=A0AAN7R473_TRANT|nr:hypothetical protein SAY86_032147 [Trapa natans]